MCGFPVKDTVPLTFPHLLAFPLHMAIMTDPAFPFPAVGTVHLANSITAHRPVAAGESSVTVTTAATRCVPHPKGRTVDLVTTVDRRRRDGVGDRPRRTCAAAGATTTP